ncbi:YkvA family protein [Egicoccus sp. AB-alg6-2]|uniref:YkvA family protein n=1 Tax=Egicoccus sp. AB-alg6-2 TaxID=3242692 RepID=UPI00359EAD13
MSETTTVESTVPGGPDDEQGLAPARPLPRGRWREAVAMLPDLLRLLRDLSSDPRVPRRAKLYGLAAAAYVAVPIDVVPDFLPVVGALDDIAVVVLALRRLVAAAGYDLVRERWTGTDDGFALLIVLTGVER